MARHQSAPEPLRTPFLSTGRAQTSQERPWDELVAGLGSLACLSRALRMPCRPEARLKGPGLETELSLWLSVRSDVHPGEELASDLPRFQHTHSFLPQEQGGRGRQARRGSASVPGGFTAVVQSLSHVRLPFDPMDCSPPGSSVHGILRARRLEWAAISFSRDLPDPGIKPTSPALQADSLPSEPPGTHQGCVHMDQDLGGPEQGGEEQRTALEGQVEND